MALTTHTHSGGEDHQMILNLTQQVANAQDAKIVLKTGSGRELVNKL